MAVIFQEHKLGSLTSLGTQVTLAATYTINIWVKNVTLPGQEWANLFQQTSGWKYVLDANYGAIGTGAAPRLAAGASSPLQVADTWHLVSAVYDGSIMEYYVNGVSIGSITPASPPTEIDVLNGPAGQEFAAEVKDMRVYSGVATASEILVSFNNGDGDLLPLALTDGLVAKYPLDTDAIATVGLYNGTASNVTFSSAGSKSFATLNGTNSEILLDQSIGDIWGSDASISLWVKTTATSGMIFMAREAYSGSSQSYMPLEMQSDGSARLPIWRSKQGVTATQPTWAATVINNDQWHNLTIVRSATTLSLYVDGTLEGTLTNVQNDFISNVPVRVGSYSASSGSPGNFFAGEVDDVRIWSRALSTADTATLFAAGAEAAVTTIDLDVAQFDAYGDTWNGGSLTISDANGVTILATTGPADGITSPAGLTETISVVEGIYTYTMDPGSYPSENSATITDQYGTLLASLVGGSGTGTFVVSLPVSTITPVLSVSSGEITVSATINSEATTAGATQWAYSLSALGAVGQPHGGTLVALGASATVTPGSVGVHTVYVAAVDTAGNVVVDNSDTIDNSPTVSVEIVKTDSYDDSWDGTFLVITHVGTSNIIYNETLAAGVSPLTIPLDLLYGDYTWALVGGGWIAEHTLSITLASDGSVLASSIAGAPSDGAFTVSAPAASITPATSVLGAAITVSATVNAVATAEGAANWSASLTGFGAVGATIDGAKALTTIGVDAALTAPSGGSHTVYAAVVDAAGVILAKADASVSIFISQLNVGDDIILMSYLEHPSLSPTGTHDQMTDDDGDLFWGPFYIGDLTIKSLSINSQDPDTIVTDVIFDNGSGGDLDLGALVIELIKKYNLNLLSGDQASDGAFFQSVVDGTAGINAHQLLGWDAEGTSTLMFPTVGGHYAEYDAMLYGTQIEEVPPGSGYIAGPNGNSFVGIIEAGEEAPAQDPVSYFKWKWYTTDWSGLNGGRMTLTSSLGSETLSPVVSYDTNGVWAESAVFTLPQDSYTWSVNQHSIRSNDYGYLKLVEVDSGGVELREVVYVWAKQTRMFLDGTAWPNQVYAGDFSAPETIIYNWTHGELSNIVKYVNGYDAASNRSHMYLKNDGGDTVVYFTPDLETWSSFGTYDVGAHSIEGAPVCAAYGTGGRVLIGTSTGCVYLVQLNEVSVPTSFTKVHDNGGMRINQVHFGVTSDAWLLEYDEKVYTMPAEGGALSLRMSIPAGSFVIDFSQADDATCIIIRKADYSFATYIALPGWATIHDESVMRAIFTSLGVSDINYNYSLDKWTAADNNYNVIETDQIVDWLLS